MDTVFFIYFYLLALVLDSRANDFCSAKYCRNTKQHTLCKFQSSKPASHCIDYEKTTTTDEVKRAILDKLNSRRNKVAAGEIRSLPPAASMIKLEWNNDLEVSAQRWADQCVKHNTPDLQDTCRDLEAVPVGQNIATVHGDAPGLTPTALVDVWYMELLNANTSIMSRYVPSSETGHSHYDYFTQLIWDESHQVGCGGVKFKERLENENTVKYRTIYRLVCNFAPAGNRLNKTVYSIGEPCSRCPLEGVCDGVQKALCNHRTTTTEIVSDEEIYTVEPLTPISTSVSVNGTQNASETASTDENAELIDEIFNIDSKSLSTTDYFAHNYPVTKIIDTLITQSQSCKNGMAVDDLLELLKRKISDDKEMKDLLLSTTLAVNNESSLDNDAVAAFLSRIYSKKDSPTKRTTVSRDDLNPTLLVDLIEAVMFRSSDKTHVTEETHSNTYALPTIQPVMMQAELAEIKQNADFTGHYFFPEDDDEKTERLTESYYDNTLPASDIMREIQDFKISTNDFLDDILESDSFTESTTSLNSISPDQMNLYTSGYIFMKKFLHNIVDQSHASHCHE